MKSLTIKRLTLKDFTTYRGAVTARARALLVQARGTHWDRIAGRVAGFLGFVAGLSAYAGFVPGRAGGLVAGVCAACAMLAPRANRAAGLLAAAYDQQRPLLPVLWEIAQVFANPTAIIAEAKSAAQAAEAEQSRQQADQTQQKQTALIEAAVTKAVTDLTDRYNQGQLSKDVPEFLKKPFESVAAPPETTEPEKTEPEKTEPLVAAMPIVGPPPGPVGGQNEGTGQGAEAEQTGDTP